MAKCLLKSVKIMLEKTKIISIEVESNTALSLMFRAVFNTF